MRVFVDHVDTYVPKNIGEVLARSVVGGIENDESGNDDDDDDQDDEEQTEASTFEVVGSLKARHSPVPKWASTVVADDDENKIRELMDSADVLVFNMSETSTRVILAAEQLAESASEWEHPKKIICISSALTWARTKLNADDPEAALTEDEFRRRKAHPNCKETLKAEKQITKLGKHPNIQTHIVMAGLTYGQGENLFHHFFKAAWQGQGALPVFGKGDNILPMIHVVDLAQVILNITDKSLDEKYIIAVDESAWSLQEIMTCISKHLGNGETKTVSKEDALLIKDTDIINYDLILVNLKMETTAVKEMRIDWVAERGLVDSIEAVAQQFKLKRGLSPIKLIIHGPPGSGKTHFAKIISQKYKLHHIKVQDVIEDAISKLKNMIETAKSDNGDSEVHENPQIAAASDMLDEIMEGANQNDGRYTDDFVCDAMRNRLLTMPCQNQGYVLDGFPKTAKQAQLIFKAPEEQADSEGEDRTDSMFNTKVIPGTIFALDASDMYLEERIMNLPESEVGGTHNTEEGHTRRLRAFRQLNTEENTVMNYFDELEIHPIEISASKDEKEIVEIMTKELGKPNNYGPTREELDEINRIKEEEAAADARKAAAEQARIEQEEKEHRAKRDAEWSERFEQLKKEEAEILAERSVPLRAYLAKNIMPSLTKALIETCKIRPDDPVDFIAEFLFNSSDSGAPADSSPEANIQTEAEPTVPPLSVETAAT